MENHNTHHLNKQISELALPNIITNITVPLLGIVDLAIVGHLGNELYIGAIAIGTMIFNMIYWNFGFLRAGTGGLTAQAYGAGNIDETAKIFVRASIVALTISVLLISLQVPMAKISKIVVNGDEQMINMALKYFYIRIWAAPATLGMYTIKGWFIGMQDSKLPMWISIILNILNIVSSLIFVYVFNKGIAGVALGTVLAQYSGLLAAIFFWFKTYGFVRAKINFKDSINLNDYKHFFKINTDIFLRTLCLTAVFTFIPAISARMGNRILAINTLLMQLFTIFSYILDGYAYAGEALVGKFIGAKNKTSLIKTVRYLTYWGMSITIVFTILYVAFGKNILSLLTNDSDVILNSMDYIHWAVLVPICGFLAFIFDGIYIGATASKAMRNTIFIATMSFFVSYYTLHPVLHNDAVWIALLIFLLLRGILLLAGVKKNIYNLV